MEASVGSQAWVRKQRVINQLITLLIIESWTNTDKVTELKRISRYPYAFNSLLMYQLLSVSLELTLRMEEESFITTKT